MTSCIGKPRGLKAPIVEPGFFHMSDSTQRPRSSSFLGLPYRILNINHKKELLRVLWAV